jgi:hypothetical protein
MRFFTRIIWAGLILCLIAAFAFLRLPASHAPTLTALCLRALLFVFTGSLAGAVGSRFYWKRSPSPWAADPPIPFSLFVLAGAAGWAWVPAVVLLGREDSPLTAAIAILGTALLAFSLRKAIPMPPAEPQRPVTAGLFDATLRTPPRPLRGYVLSIGIYVAACQLFNGWILNASALLAGCVWFFVWTLTLAPPQPIPVPQPTVRRQTRHAAQRLVFVLICAFLVTLFALVYGVGHRNRLEAAAGRAPAAGDDAAQAASNPAAGLSAYHSVILWPVPEKDQIVAPLTNQMSFLAPGTTKPLIIRFDGPYWFFQPPAKAPGASAIQARGTPLIHDLESNNFVPLIMQAHQDLGMPIPIDRCREINLSILNKDNRPGTINIALLLTDSTQPSNQLYLGQQTVASSQPGSFTVKSAATAEVLRFEVPTPAKIRKFDHISVLFFPDAANYQTGPKVAIDQFELIPR